MRREGEWDVRGEEGGRVRGEEGRRVGREEGGRVESEGESEEITEPLSGGHYYSANDERGRGGG